MILILGGGGLIAGMSLALKTLNPRIKIYGVEATAMPGMYVSVLNDKVTKVPKMKTMADGIAVETMGEIPFALAKKYVDEIVLVSEEEIAGAILALLEVEKTVVEASGATGLAALMANRFPELKGKQVGIIATGGNIDMTLLGRIIEKGLVKDGRIARMRVTVEDVPGQIAKLTKLFASLRVNIRDIDHERAFLAEHVGYTQPTFTLDTRGKGHIEEVMEAVKKSGFPNVFLV